MRQERTLTRSEALLRDPATGSSDLAAAPGVWHELVPHGDNEVYDLSALAISVAGPTLLANLNSFGTSAGSLEICAEVYDGYGSVRDLAALVPDTTGPGGEWNDGVHTGTFADRDAGRRTDRSDRMGLRGTPLGEGAVNPAPAQWSSSPIELRDGSEIVAVSWECWRLSGPAGDTIAPPTIDLEVGRHTNAGINWTARQTVANTAVGIDQGFADLANPAVGDMYRWHVALPYAAGRTALDPGESILRTAILFSICVWIRGAGSRWHFGSLAELVERSEIDRYVGPLGWNGGAEDVLLLRLPLYVTLRAHQGERLRARLLNGQLSFLEIYPVVDLQFEAH